MTFRLLYVFVVIHHGSRRVMHFNVTAHPTAAWTLQQLREAISFEDSYRYLIHDRDCIFAKTLDDSIERLRLKILKSPLCSPLANAICERLIGTIRRECFDWLIPISEAHLRLLLKEWSIHYNRSRPHMALGPGVPDPPAAALRPLTQPSRHRISEGLAACQIDTGWLASRVFSRAKHWSDRISAEHSGQSCDYQDKQHGLCGLHELCPMRDDALQVRGSKSAHS